MEWASASISPHAGTADAGRNTAAQNGAMPKFRSKKQEIEDRVAKLTEEIKGLQPEKEQTSNKEVCLQLFDPQESLPVGGLEGERVDVK